MLRTASTVLADLHASMNRTMLPATANRSRCWPYTVERRTCEVFQGPGASGGTASTPWRTYAEMLWSGVLKPDQVDDIYMFLSKENSLMRLGTIAGSKQGWNNQYWPFVSHGFGYGLLHHDFIERFLLHFFANSAHSYTRGTWTAPESTNIDRDSAS